jgi:CheY-like chemotaxis protein
MSISVRSVLYVDDDVLSHMVMRLLLVNEMHLPCVTMFDDSSNFMERVKALPVKPDVILLDIHIKPLTGFEMLKLLREDGFSEAAIIALTASVMNEEVAQLKTAGFNGVIAKPVNVDVFPKLWERILNKEQIWGIV